MFIEGVEEKLNIDSNLYRFEHYENGVLKYNMIDNYYIVLDKNKTVVSESRLEDVDIDKNR